MNTQTIGIAGAGIIGRLTALALMQQGHQVTLFDQDPIVSDNLCDFAVNNSKIPDFGTTACSYTAAGMLTPFSEAETAEPLVYKLGEASLRLWPQLIKTLGAEVFYQTNGTLIVSHNQDRADFDRVHASIRANITPSPQQLTLINKPYFNQLEPQLSGQFHQALYAPDEAWLCSCCVMPALANNLLQQGISWHSNTRVETVAPGNITINTRNGIRDYAFDWVIDCRGLGAKQQLPELRGVRGEILWLKAPEVKINRLVRLIHPRYRIYIVPRRDDLYLIGATQIESEDQGAVTVRSSLELLSAAYSVHPGFGEARIVHSDVNLRPALPDNQPQVAIQPGLIAVNGLFRHGYLTSPAIANEISSAITADGHFRSKYPGLIKQTSPQEVSA